MKPLYCRYGDLVNFQYNKAKGLAVLVEVNDNTRIHSNNERLSDWESKISHYGGARHQYIWARFLIDGVISGQRLKYTVWNHCGEAAHVPER